MHTFGCVAYAKRVGLGVTKLSDRSVLVVFLDYKLGSKAYHVFDPVNNKLMVTRDVIFDEKKGWNWEEKESRKNSSAGVSFGFSVHYPNTVDDLATGPVVDPAPDSEEEAPPSPAAAIPSPGGALPSPRWWF